MSDQNPKSGLPSMASVLAIIFVQGFVLVFAGAFLTNNTALVNTMSEALKAVILVIVGFYYGSSKSSQAKDATLAQIAGSDGASQ